MNRHLRAFGLRATTALVTAALHASALAQTLPPPPVSPAPVTNYEYDAQGNQTKVTSAPGVSGFNFSTVNTFDPLNRLKDSTDPKAGKVQFQYDGQDRNTQVTDPRNLVTRTPRNGLGDVTQLVSPDTGTSGMTYDAAGNLLTRTDSRGVKATYTWDAINRPTAVTFAGTGFTTETYGWVYDQNAPPTITYGIGRLTGHDYPAGNARYGYNPLGHMVYAQWQVFQTAYNARVYKTLQYTYDGAGKVTSITYPSGRVVTYAYTRSRLDGISVKASASATTAQPLISQIHWRPFGPADGWQWQMASGTKDYSRVYDLYGRMVRYPLGPTVRDLTYDAGDRISQYTHYDAATANTQPSLDQRFGYDELGRLTSVTTATSSWTIGYDANGNRTSVSQNGSSRAYTTQATSNRLSTISNPSRSFAYDNAGNTSSDSQGYTATYGANGQLASITKAGVTTSYSYNTLGQRIRKSNGTAAGTTVYAYDFNTGNLLGEYDSNGNAIKEYIWMGSTPIAVMTPDPANSANPPLVYYVYADHLDTPRVIVDKNNAIRWRWISEPFGTTAVESNPSGLGNFVFNPRMPGQYFDQESGLFYNWMRSYDASTGSYRQSDPLGLAGGINTYAYVSGNPLSRIDPTGEIAIADDVVVGGAVLALGCAMTPACRQATGDAVSGIGNLIFNKPFVNDPQAQAEHDAYKDRSRQTPPPNFDECERLKWLLKREQDVVQAMKVWDTKWLAGRHAQAIVERMRGIDKLKEQIKKKCGNCE